MQTNLLNFDFMNDTTLQDVENEFNKVINFLNTKTKQKHVSPLLTKSWEHSTYIELSPTSMNCTTCSNCGRWITDVTKHNQVEKLNKGYYYQEMILCDKCMSHIEEKK